MMRFLLPLALIVGTFSPVAAQFETAPKKPGRTSFADLGKVTVEVTPKEAKPGETVQIKLTVAPQPGAWTYPVNPKDPTQPARGAIAAATAAKASPVPSAGKGRFLLQLSSFQDKKPVVLIFGSYT